MGNHNLNYYTKINKESWFISRNDEINLMKNMIKNNLKKYIFDENTEINEEIKIVLYFDDFYKLLNNKKYEGFIKIYERKLFGLKNIKETEVNIRHDRIIYDEFYEIINNEIITIIEECENIKEMMKNKFYICYNLSLKIKDISKNINNFEGDELRYNSLELLKCIERKKNIIRELKNENINISESSSENDLENEEKKYNKILEKCEKILMTTRHKLNYVNGVYLNNIYDLNIKMPSAPLIVYDL